MSLRLLATSTNIISLEKQSHKPSFAPSIIPFLPIMDSSPFLVKMPHPTFLHCANHLLVAQARALLPNKRGLRKDARLLKPLTTRQPRLRTHPCHLPLLSVQGVVAVDVLPGEPPSLTPAEVLLAALVSEAVLPASGEQPGTRRSLAMCMGPMVRIHSLASLCGTRCLW